MPSTRQLIKMPLAWRSEYISDRDHFVWSKKFSRQGQHKDKVTIKETRTSDPVDVQIQKPASKST